MNGKLAKRIRKNHRNEFPQTNEFNEDYRRDIRKLSKETKKLLKSKSILTQNPKSIVNKRQTRKGGKRCFPQGLIKWNFPTDKKLGNKPKFKVVFLIFSLTVFPKFDSSERANG